MVGKVRFGGSTMKVWGALAAAALVCAGCASGGPSGSQVLTSSLAPNKSRVVIYRTSPFGIALQPAYLIDGKTVGNSQPGGFVACTVAPGKHEIKIANAARGQALGGGTDIMTVSTAPGKTTYLLATPQMGLVLGEVHLTEVTESQGRTDTAALSQIAGGC
jgi:hypothetical protein